MEAGVHELTAGYALDALSPEERRAYEAHLEGCERCREELGTFWETTDALAVAASGPAPSEGLRDRILAAARAEPQNVVPFEPRRSRVAPALAAAAAVGGPRGARHRPLGGAALGRPGRRAPRARA